MKNFFRSMLSSSSDVSSMRLSFLFLVLVAAILAPAFGGKAVQSLGEQPKGGAQ